MTLALRNVLSDIGEQWIEKHPQFFYHRHHYHRHIALKQLDHLLTPTGLTHQEFSLMVPLAFFCDVVYNFFIILKPNK